VGKQMNHWFQLAYDIITKVHTGMIKGESKEGEGSIFIIQLPII
jgi:hypothetical protein